MSPAPALRAAYQAWVAAEIGDPSATAWRELAKQARRHGYYSRDVAGLILKLRERFPDIREASQ